MARRRSLYRKLFRIGGCSVALGTAASLLYTQRSLFNGRSDVGSLTLADVVLGTDDQFPVPERHADVVALPSAEGPSQAADLADAVIPARQAAERENSVFLPSTEGSLEVAEPEDAAVLPPREGLPEATDSEWKLVSLENAGYSSGCSLPKGPDSFFDISLEDCKRRALIEGTGGNTINYKSSSRECYVKHCDQKSNKLVQGFGGWDVLRHIGTEAGSLPQPPHDQVDAAGPDRRGRWTRQERLGQGGKKPVRPAASAALAQSLRGANRGCSDMSSRRAMENAGWRISAQSVSFQGDSLSAWEPGPGRAKLRLVFNRSGIFKALVVNQFGDGDASNVVTITVNNVVVNDLKRFEKYELCLTFAAGDELVISEEYSQIQLRKVECLPEPINQAAEKPSDAGAFCAVEERVFLQWTKCGSSQFLRGTVQESVNSSAAFVLWGTGHRQLISLEKYKLLPSLGSDVPSRGTSGSTSCTQFSSEQRLVGLVVVADAMFQKNYATQIATLRCLAKRHKYEMFVLDGSEFPKCKQFRDFFFKKHCLVAMFLESKPEGYMAVVVDGDVIAVSLNHGLERWTSRTDDIQLYERVTGHEIAAGNYIARNTPWARTFLMEWAKFERRRPKGFSSADNGALHIHILESVGSESAKSCGKIFASLKQLVPGGPEYWKFINCAKGAMGRPRAWHAVNGGKLTIWPRLHFFVMDGVYANFAASDELGPMMHHGIKNPGVVKTTYYKDIRSCTINPKVLKGGQEYGLQLLRFARSYPEFFPQGNKCKQCIERCVRTLSCQPLAHDDPMDA
eukprot:TRINITY_DN49205_c0_g1_i1.p1 TRINITY_DN49205_c0_g1~~TRINITY_DN49205_c0_g1_i1.p1  ORF type:complete len:794 (+),score=119.13 TRINITY_DN49205_c0_g1_i1:129-2510(+)